MSWRGLEPALAGHHFTAACYSPHEGQVDVPSADPGLSQEPAKSHGVIVREGAGAVALRKDSDGITGASTGDGDERERTLWSSRRAHRNTVDFGTPAGVTIPQEVSPGIVIRTDARPRLLQNLSLVHLPAIDVQRMEMHLRQLPDGTLHMGQGTQESLDRDDSQAHADDLLDRATYYFPALQGATAIPQPVGYRPMPADGLPVLGFSQAVPGLYVGMMHSGVTLAPSFVGELAAIEIAEGVIGGLASAPYRLGAHFG